jgi:hypothetical protein
LKEPRRDTEDAFRRRGGGGSGCGGPGHLAREDHRRLIANAAALRHQDEPGKKRYLHRRSPV